MLRSLRSILVATAFVVVALSTASAFAAPSGWESVNVTLHAEEKGSVLLVAGTLPVKTALPATAELSVPAGSEIQWVGEILGGPPADDPALKYKMSTADGVDVYRFTMTKSRTAQAEIPTTAGQLFDGTAYTSSVAWSSAQDVPEVRLSLRVPDGAKAVVPVAGAVMQPGDSGYSFYTKTVKNVKAGDKLDLQMVYTVSAAGAAVDGQRTPKEASSSSGATVLALFIAVIAFAVGAIVLTRRNKASSSAPDAVDARKPSKTSKPADADADTAAPAPRSAGASKRNLITAIIIGVFVLGTVIVGVQGTKPKMAGGVVTEVFAQGESCATATIALKVPDGEDPAATAKTLFTVLRPLSNTATYNADSSSIAVGYCESKSSESALKAALAPTGLVAQ